MADDFDWFDDLVGSGPSSGGPADAGFDYSMFDNYGTDDDPLYGFDLADLLKTSGPSSGGPADAGFDYSMFDDKKDDKNAFQKIASALGSAFGAKGDKSPGTLEMLALLAGTSLMKDRGMMNPDVPVVGYRGEIPKYQAIQEQVTGRDDSNRRPGSGGRRYMSDVIYAKAPENQEPMSVAEAQAKAKAQAQGFAEGGYLNGDSDGQADEVPGSIDGVQEARLSHGEYVLPADLVSLLGNGNSDAGAKALDDFMAMVRKQGTGTEKQQKNIDAVKVLETLTKKPKRAPRANKALARKMGKG